MRRKHKGQILFADAFYERVDTSFKKDVPIVNNQVIFLGKNLLEYGNYAKEDKIVRSC